MLSTKSARMAASIRGFVSRISMGCRYVRGACLRFEGNNGVVGYAGGGNDGEIVPSFTSTGM